ncbi:MAG: hypothetical protein ACI80V_000541 [Rhodothermales bacterium]|jgi:hypothetical protein
MVKTLHSFQPVFPMASATVSNSNSSLNVIFNLYMQGQITERVWRRTMRLMDSQNATKHERAALARYVGDMATENGVGPRFLPKVREMKETLAQVRNA